MDLEVFRIFAKRREEQRPNKQKDKQRSGRLGDEKTVKKIKIRRPTGRQIRRQIENS